MKKIINFSDLRHKTSMKKILKISKYNKINDNKQKDEWGFTL